MKNALLFALIDLYIFGCGGGGSSSSSNGAVASAAGPSGSSSTDSSSNNLPSFSSSDNISVVENQIDAATVEIDDADSDDSLSLEITGGDDRDLFELGVCTARRCTNNNLNFKSAPDFEDPQDADKDNIYQLTLSASDGSDNETQDLNISVSNYAFIFDAKEKLISDEFNVPTINPVEDLCIVGLDVPEAQKTFCEEVYGLLHSTLGGYPNYLHVIWNESGSDDDTKPVLDKLNYVKNATLSVSDLSQDCLSGNDQGKGRTATTNPYSLCYESMQWTADPFGGDDSDFIEAIELSLHYAHEYFHHYQRAHALERGIDYQYDRDNPSTTVEAPTWWIEPAAVAFQNAWFRKNFASLSIFSNSTLEEVTQRNIRTETDAAKYKRVRRSLAGVTGDTDENCTTEWMLSTLDETYDTWTECDGVGLAVPYLAQLTSWKTVWVDIPMNYYDLGFWGALQKFTGLTKDEFYTNYYEFIRSGDPEDEPSEGWAPADEDITEANFLNVNYEKL